MSCIPKLFPNVPLRIIHAPSKFEAPSKTFTISLGSAGSGKTFYSMKSAHAIKGVKEIWLTRALVYADKNNLGYMPGGIDNKSHEWSKPMTTSVKQGKKAAEVFHQLGCLRGCNLPSKSCLVIDEAQNSSYPQLKLVLSRPCEGAHVIVVGDVDQCDLPGGREHGGLWLLLKYLNELGPKHELFKHLDVLYHTWQYRSTAVDILLTSLPA